MDPATFEELMRLSKVRVTGTGIELGLQIAVADSRKGESEVGKASYGIVRGKWRRYKSMRCKNCQRHSCSAINCLSSGTNILVGVAPFP